MDRHELRARRLALGLSQPQLAALLDINSMTISRWERGVVALPAPGMLHWALRGLERSRRRPAPVRRRGPMRA
jgi:transcriptional regulator with XRE-family HTH domain